MTLPYTRLRKCLSSRVLRASLLAACVILIAPLLSQLSDIALGRALLSTESTPEDLGKPASSASPASEGAHISTLLSALQESRDPDSRRRAVEDLRDLGSNDPRIIPALLSALRKDRDPAVRVEAALALGESGAKPAQVDHDLLAALKADRDPHVRGAAALAVGAADGSNPEVLAALLATFQSDSDPQVRGEAACALTNTQGQVSTAVPVKALVSAEIPVLEANDDPEIRATAAAALGRNGLHERDAVDALLGVLKSDEDPHVRAAAAGSLAQTGVRNEQKVVDALTEALEADNEPHVRAATATSLAQIGMRDPRLVGDPKIERGLLKALSVDDPVPLRVAAASVLGALGGDNSTVVATLVDALKPKSDPYLRLSATTALGQIAMRNPTAARDPARGSNVVNLLLVATRPDNDAQLRRAAAWALGTVSSPDPTVVAGLVDALQPKNESQLRGDAANALTQIGTRYPTFAGDPNVVEGLIGALNPKNDLGLRVLAARALGQLGRDQLAVSALIGALKKDSEPQLRDAAAEALGSGGAEADNPAVLDSLVAALAAGRCGVACAGSIARLAAISTATKSPQLEIIPRLEAADRLIRAKLGSDPSFDSQAARSALDYIDRSLDSLKWTANRIWWVAVLRAIQAHPWTTGGVGMYLVLLVTCLLLLWRFPVLIFQINESFRPYSEFSLPSAFGGLKVPLSRLLIVGFFEYHHRVLDAWVARHLVDARSLFERVTTVKDRAVHVEAPVQLNGKKVVGLTPQDLDSTFKKKLSCVLIWGEGGAGKTSLACQIGKWAMSEDEKMWLCEHPMLSVIIEPDSILGLDDSHDLLDVTRGYLKALTEEGEAPPAELVARLLKRRRILVIVDGLSEFNAVARNLVRPDDANWPVNALVLTSRMDEKPAGPDCAVIKPMRIEGNRLSSFMDAYLTRLGKRELFDDREFFDGCAKLSSIVAGRDSTVLFTKIYAEQMIAQKEGAASVDLPRSVPELMLEYLNRLNSKVSAPGKLDDRTVHSIAKAIAWKCLSQTYRPAAARLDSILTRPGQEGLSTEAVKYLEERLVIVQVIGSARDKVRFTLDPLAEYLAAMVLVENNKSDELSWRRFFSDVVKLSGFPDSIRGFLLAVCDCCKSDSVETRTLAFAAAEIDKMLAPNSMAA